MCVNMCSRNLSHNDLAQSKKLVFNLTVKVFGLIGALAFGYSTMGVVRERWAWSDENRGIKKSISIKIIPVHCTGEDFHH